MLEPHRCNGSSTCLQELFATLLCNDKSAIRKNIHIMKSLNAPSEINSTHCGQSFNITDHRLRDSLHINCSAEIQLENSLTKPLELKCQLSSTQLKIISMNGENLKKLNRMVKRNVKFFIFLPNQFVSSKIWS